MCQRTEDEIRNILLVANGRLIHHIRDKYHIDIELSIDENRFVENRINEQERNVNYEIIDVVWSDSFTPEIWVNIDEILTEYLNKFLKAAEPNHYIETKVRTKFI